MTRFPHNSAETGPDDNRTTKKRRKKGVGLGISLIPVEPQTAEKPVKKEAGDREKMLLGGLLVKKDESQEADKSAKRVKSKEKKVAPKTTSEVDPAAFPKKSIEAENKSEAIDFTEKAEKIDHSGENEDQADSYPLLPEQKLPPTALSLGEAILYSKSRQSSDEGVFLLRNKEPKRAASLPQTPAETLVLQAQPEQPHQARTQPETPEPSRPGKETPAEVFAPTPESEPTPVAAGGGEVPPVEPPIPPISSFEFPSSPEPEPYRHPFAAAETVIPPEPAQVYRSYMEREAAARQSAAGEHLATKEEVEDAVYYATKSGLNRGVVTGLVVGGAYEHFKHKRREKKATKRFKALDKKLNDARKSYNFEQNEQDKRNIRTTARLATAEHKLNDAERRFRTLPNTPNQAEKQPAGPVQTAQVAPENPEQLAVPPEHRIQTSVWHAIEVDAKTGKLAENQTLQYGEEYHHERAQEIKQIKQVQEQRSVDTSEIALVAAAKAAVNRAHATQASGGSMAPLPPSQIPNATMQGSPSTIRPTQQQATSTPKSAQRSDDTVPLWPWLVALVVIALCLAVLLR